MNPRNCPEGLGLLVVRRLLQRRRLGCVRACVPLCMWVAATAPTLRGASLAASASHEGHDRQVQCIAHRSPVVAPGAARTE